MRYMGSKAKFADDICAILQKAIDTSKTDTYIEPMVGGANIIDKIKCKNRIGYDRSDTLIALLNLAKTNPEAIPEISTRELWDKGKNYVKNGVMPADMTLAEIGAMEFLASFRNGGFPHGYSKPEANNSYILSRQNLLQQAPLLRDIEFKVSNYYDLPHFKNCVIYVDPPYQNTKFYGYASQEQMDYTKFWNWVRELSQDNYVFVSEQTAPTDFEAIWKKETKRTMHPTERKQVTEKLFVYKEGKKI